jgi:hypothetical protein
MKIHIAATVALAALACLISVHVHAGEAEDAAVKAAEDWLALVDSGDYSKSWSEAAELFRSSVTREQWDKSLAAARKPLGEVVSREKKSAQFATSLPGAPDGEYVVIRFDTSFTNKKAAVETVTPMKDPDGTWRVSGYFIK